MTRAGTQPRTRGQAPASARARLRLAAWPMCAALAVFAAGCTIGPNYKRPPLDLPPSFRGETEATARSLADAHWWDLFRDEDLRRLVRLALTNNYDLRIAFTRVEQARQMAAVQRAAFFPQIDASGVASRGKNSFAGVTPAPNSGTASYYAVDGSVSWELDLWGRIRRLNESARAQFLAGEAAQRDVRVSIIAQVAQNYFQLLALDWEREIAIRTTNSFGDSLKIFNQRLHGGVASKLETASAEALLETAAATIPDLERQIAVQENVISVLIGQNPGPVAREHPPFDARSLPDIPAGLPSALLERRPDIQEAEQLLRATNALVGVAQANFFPKFALTGLFGQVSAETSAFTAGAANAWSWAANLSSPVFHGGEYRALYREVKAAREQALLQYKAAVLNAIAEVSNDLVARQKYAEARTEQARAVEAYREAVKIATQRYRLGNASYYEVLQEQQLLLPAENALAQLQLNQLLAVVQLYRALGGGW